MITNSTVYEYARLAGADKCGVAPVRIYSELMPRLEKRGFVPFTRTNLEMRINPYLHMKSAKSAIVCLFKYIGGDDKTVARYARGGDYHPYVKERLRKICDMLGGDYKYRLLVDTGGLCDRYLAYLAGLGFYGKNNLFYSDGLGSRFYIGSILTDLELTPEKPLDKTCLNCGLCIKRCAGGAIGENYAFDVSKCASYITQKKEPLTEQEKAIANLGGYTLGCDICADVCPLNKNT